MINNVEEPTIEKSPSLVGLETLGLKGSIILIDGAKLGVDLATGKDKTVLTRFNKNGSIASIEELTDMKTLVQ
jgi:hypothetical protein